MAVINKLNQDEENATPGAQQAPGAIPVVGAGQSAAMASTGQASATASGAPKVASGRFTNLQNYIGANKGSGEKIAGKIGENVQKAADDTNKSVGAAGAIQTQLDAEKNRLAQATGFAQQVNTDPNAIASDQNKLNQFTQLRTGQNAATDINNIAQNKLNSANSALQNLQQNAQNTATESGRFQLLQQALGRPSYNQGQQRLDQLLVQNSGGNVLNNLQKTAQQTAANANKTLAATTSNINSGVADIKSQSGLAQRQLTDSLGGLDDAGTDANESRGAFGSLQNNLKQRQQDFINSNQSLADGLRSGAATDTFNQQALDMLGLKTGQNLYNVDLKNYVNPNFAAGNISQQSVANMDDYSKYQALAKLAGTDPSYLMQNQVGTATGVSLPQDQVLALKDALANRQQQAGVAQTDYSGLQDLVRDQYDNGPGVLSRFFYDQQPNQNINDARRLNTDESAGRVKTFLDQTGGQGYAGSQSQPIVDTNARLVDWYKRYTDLNTNRRLSGIDNSGEVISPGKYVSPTGTNPKKI